LLVAVTLAEKRRREAERLAEQVDEITRDAAIEATTKATLPLDYRRMRGFPIVAQGVSGATPGTEPGTDEHLERLG
jgi:hypothetical protein